MIRVLQNLPNKLFKTCYKGGYHWANRGTAVAEAQRRRCQDGVAVTDAVDRVYGLPVLRSWIHTSSRADTIGSHKQRSDEEWRRSFKQKVEWESFKRCHSYHEAVGWGSIIVLGLQLGRLINAGTTGDQRKKSDGLLGSVVKVLPCASQAHPVSTTQSILPKKKRELRRQSFESCSSSSQESESNASSENDAWDEELSSDGVAFLRPSPSSFLSSIPYHPSSTPFNHTILKTKHSSVNPSNTVDSPSSAESLTPTFDRVTQECWGQVTNMIGIHLLSQGDEDEAVQHFQASSSAGYAKGQYNLGICYDQGKGVPQDYKLAADQFRHAAHQGHPHAQYKLGVYHLYGQGGVEQSERRAITLMMKAASADVTQAQSYLGVYFMTREVPDSKKAVPILKKAAAKEEPEALYHLAVCYEFGWGVVHNEAKAASLYHSASKHDHAPALYALGMFYEEGLGGLPVDECEARVLYSKASSLGFEKASQRLLEIDLAKTNKKAPPLLQLNSSQNFDSMISDSSKSSFSSITSSGFISHPEAVHMSHSAPELIPRRDATKTPMSSDGGGDGSHILHSLSYLTLVFPEVQKGWSVSNFKDLLGERGSFSIEGRPGQGMISEGHMINQGDRRVRFQVGGVEEDEFAPDWCEPIDSMVHTTSVPFRQAAVVI
ncbi:uncharacterized protein [Diadema setosum]|uniref:uncharacterized protein n=1 Tax=Diadema setosum TaxID=31175 RepID=UPI003B39FE02